MTESATSPAPVAPLRRAVLWAGVIAWVFAVGCALGVYFGVLYYKYESERPPTSLQAVALRVALAEVLKKVVMTAAFALAGRALFRYAGALKRSPANTAALPAMQARCWQWAIWLALVFAAGELAGAIVTAIR
jgi:hypothetical protein